MKRYLRRAVWTFLVVFGVTATIIGAAAWADRRHPDNTLPLDEVVDRSKLTTPGEVNLLVLDRRTVRSSDGKVHYRLKMVLANDTNRPIQYYGYSPLDDRGRLEKGHIDPLTDVEVLKPTGWGSQYSWRCGSGLEPLTMQPGQAAYFAQTQYGENPEFRVSFEYCDVGDERGLSRRTIVTQPIDARGGATTNIADLPPSRRPTLVGLIREWLR